MAEQDVADLEDVLRGAGFDQLAFAHRYRASTIAGLVSVPLVAFSHQAVRDATTALVLASPKPNDAERSQLLEAARFLAAPLCLTTDGHKIVAWPTDGGQTREWLVGEAPDPDVSWSLHPERLLRAKIGSLQLPLFDTPVNLLAGARARGRELLVPRIAAALALANERTPGTDGRRAHKVAARIVIGALTANVIADKSEADPQFQNREGTEMGAAALGLQLAWLKTSDVETRALFEVIRTELASGINYAGLDPAVLSVVYEECLVDDAMKRDLAVHYTPPWLAGRLLSELPIEIIAPERRLVLDPTCGSGSLLLAAHQRLIGLASRDGGSDHHQLRLLGRDEDPFAAEITRLALTLQATPVGNGWRVEDGDALKHKPLPCQPTIIVTNPPWGYASTAGGRTEKANAFVTAAVDALAPGGLIGIILPQSWLGTDTGRNSREYLTRHIEVFDIWDIEEGAFSSRSAAAVLLGRRMAKGELGTGARLFRSVRHPRFRAFGDGAPADKTWFLAPPPKSTLTIGPVVSWLQGAGLRTLKEIAIVRSGPQPTKGGPEPYPGTTPWLGSANLLRPFGTVQVGDLPHVDYPGGFLGEWAADVVRAPKVLVPESRGGPNPWKLRVAIGTSGLAFTNTLRGVTPRDEESTTLYALLALLGSGLISVYVAEQMVDRHMKAGVLALLPIPPPGDIWRRLASLGQSIVDATDNGDLERRATDLMQAEQAVFEAYAAPSYIRHLVAYRLSGELAPEGGHRYQNGSVGTQSWNPHGPWRLGWVDAIDEGVISLSVPALSEGQIVLTDASALPGWLLRTGETFEVQVCEEAFERSRFRLQAGSWREQDPAALGHIDTSV